MFLSFRKGIVMCFVCLHQSDHLDTRWRCLSCLVLKCMGTF